MRFSRYTVDGREWGPISVLRPIPNPDPWGFLFPLKETSFGEMLPVVPGKILSEALYGNPYPLIRLLGPAPKEQLRRVPKEVRPCGDRDQCALWDAKKCIPDPKLPDCYKSPLGEEATFVILTWVEGCYVLIVTEGEFSLG